MAHRLRPDDRMIDADVPAHPASSRWTCPFCPLLCDGFGVDTASTPWTLVGSDCPRAHAGLARFGNGGPDAGPTLDGAACTEDDAITAAARWLAASRQPLFAGLGTDVAGARALYPLACRTGAICDAAGGAALWHGLHALQDRGGFTTTLAEVRTRADLIVCVGGWPDERHPEFSRRCGDGAQWVLLRPAAAPAPVDVPAAVEQLVVDGDLFDLVAGLAARVAARPTGDAPGPLDGLAARLHAARYAVLVYETGRLPASGALVVEAIQRTVASLNRTSRAAALPLGGGDGAATVNAVFTWLSGLPLRSRATPTGLEHEPLRFDAARLLGDAAVDAVLWIASFGTEPPPPAVDGVPRIVLGHPGFAAAASGPRSVFLPVATPAIGTVGHLFRTDGSVLMPLHPLRDDGLPTVAALLRRLLAALPGVAA